MDVGIEPIVNDLSNSTPFSYACFFYLQEDFK